MSTVEPRTLESVYASTDPDHFECPPGYFAFTVEKPSGHVVSLLVSAQDYRLLNKTIQYELKRCSRKESVKRDWAAADALDEVIRGALPDTASAGILRAGLVLLHCVEPDRRCAKKLLRAIDKLLRKRKPCHVHLVVFSCGHPGWVLVG